MPQNRVSELFDQAIDIDEERRSAWLAAQCRGDAALQAAVERLLRADKHSQRFLETAPKLVLDNTPPRTSEEAPRMFGPFRVVRSIGQGGMGEVWLAERSDGAFDQRVAIKQLAYPTPGLLQRFHQERQILAHLEHPGIARLIDGGLASDSTPYIAMEYVDGVPLTEYAAAHELGLADRLRVFLQVCAAVQYAHQNLVVHRDLKPSNIFVTADGSVKLLDFGIAKVLSKPDEDAPTRTVARLLTPDYAAPEQFSGGAITTATDVYALGIVLFELLSGARPYRLAQLSGPAAALAMTVDPAPPSAAVDRARPDGAAKRRALRGDLDRIVMTAMAQDVTRRYSSAEALAGDIRRYLDGRPVAARGNSRSYRLRKFAVRNRYALGAAVLAFAICLGAAVISLYQAQRAREQATLAREHAERAEAVRRFLVGVFEQASPDENQGMPFTAQQLLQKGERLLSSAADPNPAIQADLTGLIGKLYWNISDNARAETLLNQTLASNADPRVPDEVKARNLLALSGMESDKRRLDVALGYAKQALQFAQQAGDAGTEELSDARRAIVNATIRQGNAMQAESDLRTALASDLATFGQSHSSVAEDWQLLGTALDELGRYEESAAAFTQAIGLWSSLRGERSTEAGSSLNDLGLLLLHKGDLSGAEAALKKSLEICVALFGPDHDDTRVTRSNLLRTVELQGRFEEALAQRTAILEDARKRVEATRPDALAFEYNFISADYRELGRFEEGEAAARAALAIWKDVQGSNDEASSAAPMSNLGSILMLRGRYDEAERVLTQALAIQRRTAAPSSQWLNLARADYGTLLRLRHRPEDALRELSEASAAVGRGAGANPWLAILDAQLSEAQLDAGDAAGARQTAAAAVDVARKALPAGNFRLGPPLFALARAELALGHVAEAESLLREALGVRGPPRAADDPRVLEVKVALAAALAAQERHAEASALAVEVQPLLVASASPYAADLRARLGAVGRR